MEQNYYNETPVQTPVQNTVTPAAVEQAVNDAFGKCLAAAIMCQFPVASIIAIFFGFQGLNMLENAKAMAAGAGISVGGKAIAAKILGMVGKGTMRDEIVALAMEAIRQIILNNWQLPPCAVADEMKNAWIGWQIGADEFLSAYCEVEAGTFTSSRAMYQQYLHYCERFDFPIAEETGFVLYVKKTFPQLDKRKVKIHGVQRNGFCDLKLKPM